MNPKAKTVLILLTPVGVLLGIFWMAALFNAARMLITYGLGMSFEMWARVILLLISSIVVFPILAWMFAKRIKEVNHGD